MQYKNEAHSKLQGCPSLLAAKKDKSVLNMQICTRVKFLKQGQNGYRKKKKNNACLASIIQYLNLIILCKLIILTFPCWDFLAKACD